MISRRQFGKWVMKGGILVPFVRAPIVRAATIINPYQFAAAAPSYSFVENFETPTTGYDNSGWTTYGSGNPAYSTSPAPLQGAQSLYCPTGGLNGCYRSSALTGEVWFYWQMYFIGGTQDEYYFYGDVTETSVRFGIQSSGKGRLVIGSTVVDSSPSFPVDQKVHVWIRYLPGAGGTASGDLYFSTDGVRGTAKAAVTGASTTANADRPWFIGRATYATIWDRIIINSTSIGDNP